MSFPSSEPVHLRDRLDLVGLVAYLRSHARTRPVAILTLERDQTAPYVAVDAVVAAAQGEADIVILPTDDLTRAFAQQVGELASVYRGACRVYPPGRDWETDPRSIPLRLARDRAEIANLSRLLLGDLRREIARAAALPAPRVSPAPGTAPARRDATPTNVPPVPAPLPPRAPASGPPSPIAHPNPTSVARAPTPLPPRAPASGLPSPIAPVNPASIAPSPIAHPTPANVIPSPIPQATPAHVAPAPTPVPPRSPASGTPGAIAHVTDAPWDGTGTDAPAGDLPSEIAQATDASVLAAHLDDPARRVPVVVVSRPTGGTEATADVAQLRQELTGLADVCEITTPEASWAFSRLVPPLCQVYGGAGRVYPVGRAWADDPFSAPLRLAFGLADRARLTRQLISDTMRLASRGGYVTAVAPASQRLVTGTVEGVAGGCGLVRLDSDGYGVLWPELVEPDLPAEQLFAPGMRVAGALDPSSRRIDVLRMRRDPAEAVAAYESGDTILARVSDVRRDACTVELFPGVSVDVPAREVTDDSDPDLAGLMSPGETLAVLLVEHDATTGEWLLSPAEADDAAGARVAPSILDGGPPWLVPPEPPSPEPAPAGRGMPTGSGETSSDDETDLIRELRAENAQLTLLVEAEREHVADLTDQLRSARTQRREGLRRSRTDREANERTRAEADRHLFLAEDDQLDFEIRLAWARRIPPAEKPARPLKRWAYGERFFQTLREVQGVSHDKVVDVIVDVLTGRDAELASRELHQLRTGTGGDDPPRTREGGETCWRVSLQVKTPQARRLHYWQCRDGSVELASIRRHDDFET